MERMAPKEPFPPKECALQEAVFSNGLIGIRGTGGIITAVVSQEWG
jgi:hypothetical protein